MEQRGRGRTSGCRGEGQSGEGARNCLLPAAGTHPYPCPLQLVSFDLKGSSFLVEKGSRQECGMGETSVVH